MALPTAQEFSEVLAWTLLHFVWQGLLIGALYAAGKHLSNSVRWQHAMALTGLLLLLIAPALTFYLLGTRIDAVGATAAGTMASASNAGMTHVDLAITADNTFASTLWTYGLVGVWLLGSLIVGSRLVRDWHEVRKAIRDSAEPSLELLTMLARQMQRIGVLRKVRLRLTDRISTPAVYGFLRPVVLLPTALALSLPRDQLETLLAHELAHIRRADFIANSLALVARTFLYFHPVVHWICRDLERSRETLCDDLVVELKVDRLKYARALSTVEHFRQKIPVPLLTAVGGELTSRVHRILAIETETRQDKSRAPLLLSLAAVVVTIAGINGITSEQLATARPEFRVVYGALMGTAPAVAPPALPRAQQPSLPASVAIATTRIVDDAAPAAMATLANSPPVAEAAPAPIELSADAPLSSQLTASDAAFASTLLEQTTAATSIDSRLAALPDFATSDLDSPPPASPIDAAPQVDPAPRVLNRVQPDYPWSARRNGTEGSVTLSYSVDDRGVPVDVSVVASDPPHTFEDVSLDAFERWRFETTAPAGKRHTQTFSFNLQDESGGQRCVRHIGSGICRTSKQANDDIQQAETARRTVWVHRQGDDLRSR